MNKGKFFSFLFIINYAFIEGNKDKNIRNLEELPDDIVILHINDVHCAINKTIGYDGFALYRNEMKKKYKNIITVDVGDHIQGGSIGAISKGEAIIKLMNKIEFNAVTIGNHEFDYGIDQLYKLGNELSNKYICSNFCFRKNKTTVFDPYKVIEAGNKTIGFIGVLIPSEFSKTYLSSLKDENNEPIYDLLVEYNETILFEKVQGFINVLKNEKKVDYIILLIHFGGIYTEGFNIKTFLSKLENVDIVLDGNSHEIFNSTIKDKNNKEILIAQTSSELQSIGQLIIKQNGIITSEIIETVPEPNDNSAAMKVYRDNQNRWVDKEIKNFIDKIWKDYSYELNKIIGYSNFDFLIITEKNEPSLCLYQECTLGNLIADAIKDSANSEIAILNGGSIINNMLKGNLTIGQIINVIPWYNNIIVKRVPGQVIFDALEYAVNNLPNSSTGFLQVSGLTFNINPDIINRVKNASDKLNFDGERRVSNVKVNEEDLNLTKLYNVSLLESIGDGAYGYTMFTKYNSFIESLLTDTDSLIHYIKYNLKGDIPEKYKDLQKRITIHSLSNSQATDGNLQPKIQLLSFYSYKFSENPYMIEFNVIVSISNYLDDEINSLIMTVDIEYSRLRFLEEEEVICIISNKMPDIYDFYCSKEVNGPVSRLSVISDNIIINGKSPANSSTSEVAKNFGENMQNQTSKFFSDLEKIDSFFDNCSVYTKDNKLLFEGETNNFKITSRESLLVFGQGEYIKNIVCDINEEGNNKFKMICEPTFIVNVDFSGNNEVYINDFQKIIMMRFEEGKSSTILEVDNTNLKLFKKSSGGGISKGPILLIIILFITLLAIIIIIVYFCKKRTKKTKENKTNPSEHTENNTTLPSASKDKIENINISGGNRPENQ